MVCWSTDNGSVAIVGGVRTPFVKAGSQLRHVRLTELARVVMQETLYRHGWDGAALDEVILGNVVMPAEASNPARVAATQAGVPHHVPAFTVQRNCASGIEAVGQGARRIHSGGAHSVLAAGGESMSSIPLVLPTSTLEPMGRLVRAKSLRHKMAALSSFRLRHLRPIAALEQGLTDPLCDMIMGQTAEVLAHEFSISRTDQDGFALESHQRAVRAMEAGHFEEQIVPIYCHPKYDAVATDIGPRPDQAPQQLAKLRPIFDRRDGTVTVGNACQITDGAAALLLADGQRCRADGLETLGTVRAYATAALDPMRMGLGPVYAIDRILSQTGLKLDDIDLFEINEAFAAQVLACRIALSSAKFCRGELGRGGALGEIDPQRLNVNGGAIALGHPVGATGTRIVLNLLFEMRRRNSHLGIAALCVAGGQGAAMLLERSP